MHKIILLHRLRITCDAVNLKTIFIIRFDRFIAFVYNFSHFCCYYLLSRLVFNCDHGYFFRINCIEHLYFVFFIFVLGMHRKFYNIYVAIVELEFQEFLHENHVRWHLKFHTRSACNSRII